MTIVCNGGCVPSLKEAPPSPPTSHPSPRGAEMPKEINLSGRQLKYLPDLKKGTLIALDLSGNHLGHREGACDFTGFDHLARLNLSANELRRVPPDLTALTSLKVVSFVGNELETLPEDIGNIHELRQLRADFNHLCNLPLDISTLSRLVHLTLSNNKLKSVPTSLWMLQSLESLHLHRNRITHLGPLPDGATSNLRELKLSRNQISGSVDLNVLQSLIILDVSFNNIEQLEIAELENLEKLNCCHNELKSLRLHGKKLHVFSGTNNCLENIESNNSAMCLEIFDISQNRMCELPSWLHEVKTLKVLNASHNRLTTLQNRLSNSMIWSTEILWLNHNLLAKFPDLMDVCSVKVLYLQYNNLGSLPENFFTSCPLLEIINLSYNQLESLPSTMQCENLRTALLSGNKLNKTANLQHILKCTNLEILHLADNEIKEIPDEFLENLTSLRELSLAGNQLQKIPYQFSLAKRLQKLYLHSNKMVTLPPLTDALSLQVLDLACNNLHHLELLSLVPEHLTYLDLSANCKLHVDPKEFQNLCNQRPVAVVDVNCASRVMQCDEVKKEIVGVKPWLLGFTESHEGKTRLYIDLQKNISSIHQEALIALMEVQDPKLLSELRILLPEFLRTERGCEETSPHYLRNALLSAIRFLHAKGHTKDPGITVCHLSHVAGNPVTLRLATVGRPSSCIFGRAGNAVILSQRQESSLISTDEWNESLQASEVCSTNDFIPIPNCSAPKGSWSSVLDPEVRELVLSAQDKFIVFGDSDFARTVVTEEVYKHVLGNSSPVAAAKSLSEMYSSLASGKRECVAVVMLQGCHQTGGEEEVEKYRCWEFMLEQNHKLLFTKELETIHKTVLKNGDQRLRIGDPSSWYNVALSKYKCPLPSHRGSYYCYGNKGE